MLNPDRFESESTEYSGLTLQEPLSSSDEQPKAPRFTTLLSNAQERIAQVLSNVRQNLPSPSIKLGRVGSRLAGAAFVGLLAFQAPGAIAVDLNPAGISTGVDDAAVKKPRTPKSTSEQLAPTPTATVNTEATATPRPLQGGGDPDQKPASTKIEPRIAPVVGSIEDLAGGQTPKFWCVPQYGLGGLEVPPPSNKGDYRFTTQGDREEIFKAGRNPGESGGLGASANLPGGYGDFTFMAEMSAITDGDVRIQFRDGYSINSLSINAHQRKARAAETIYNPNWGVIGGLGEFRPITDISEFINPGDSKNSFMMAARGGDVFYVINNHLFSIGSRSFRTGRLAVGVGDDNTTLAITGYLYKAVAHDSFLLPSNVIAQLPQ